jgi:hypothetical protein
MRVVSFASVAFCLMGLAACSTQPVYTYAPPRTPGEAYCESQCRQAKDFCRQPCEAENHDCVGVIQTQAVRSYENYARACFEAHKPIEKSPGSFEHTESCDRAHQSCLQDCEATHHACYTACGGTIKNDTHTFPF